MGRYRRYPLKGRVCKGPPFEISLCNRNTMPFCRECGKEVQEDWITCPYCSAQIEVVSKLVASVPSMSEALDYRISILAVLLVAGVMVLGPFHTIADKSLVQLSILDCNSDSSGLGDDFDNWAEDSCKELKQSSQIKLGLILLVNTIIVIAIYLTNNKDNNNQN